MSRCGMWGEHAKSALGAVAAILAIGWLASETALPLLLAPLGATAVILGLAIRVTRWRSR